MFKYTIENGVILTVVILILCLFGVIAMFRVPVQMIPDLDARIVTIRTTWAGAAPQDIEQEILVEQEEYLRSIPNLERMTSMAETGSASIELEFPHGTDINEILIRVNNALTRVSGYPENVDQPQIVTSSVSDSAFMYFRVQPLPGNPKRVNMVMMYDFIDKTIIPQIERIPGVSEVAIWGGAERQVRVYIDPAKLAQRKISLEQLRSAIRARNRDFSGGDLESGKRRYLLRTRGGFHAISEIEEMIIASRDGVPIRVKDVGHVELTHYEVQMKSFANGRPNITLGVRRQVGSNVIEIMDEVMLRVAEINQTALKTKGLQIELTSEDVVYVKNAIATVRQNLMIGGVLATAVLFLFLGSGSATLVGAAGIPVCTIAAFLGLLMTGRTLNVISLAGVAFAIGMTLDNSIVVLENIYRHMAMGKSRFRAALDGVREVWTAVLASTLTTVFVFLPIIFVTEEAGQLYSDIAIAISASVLMSMLVAVTVIPTACSRFLQPARKEKGFLPAIYRRGARIGDAILVSLDWLLTTRIRRLACVAITLLATGLIIVALTPKAEYLPEGEESKTFSFMYAPPGYNLEIMTRYLQNLHAYFIPHLADDPELYHRGKSEVPALHFVVSYVRPKMLLMIVETRESRDIDDLIAVLSKKFGEFPGMISFSSRGSIFASNLGGTRSINLDISGNDLPSLFTTGLKVYQRVQKVFDKPQVRPDPPNLSLGQPLIEILPDWERTAEAGISAEELGYAIWALADGAFVDEIFLNDDKIDVFLFSTEGNVKDPQDLENLLLYTEKSGVQPLGSLAEIRPTVSTEVLRRVDGQRTITLSIIPPRAIPLETGLITVEQKIIQDMRASSEIPPGIKMRISGASDRLKATRDALDLNFIVAILISYLLMVAIFSHWGYPLIIMSSVPLGISGGIVGLWLFNALGSELHLLGLRDIQQPFDVITMMGFVVLIGTVVNNPILIVEQTLENLRSRHNTIREAVVEAIRIRLRPIIMSNITTILGLAPLVFLPGAGTELYRGLGTIVLFGILFSTLVTLTFMPALLSLILDFTYRGNNLRSQVREAH
ncbi:MAG: efflux RND transporter permease subunit [Gammaproteobacteria bacterium]